MKQSIPFSIAALFCASGFATAEPVYTTPVGYMTVPIPGTGGVGTSKLQLANQGLLPSGPAAAGGGDSVTFDANVLTDTNGNWAPGDFVNGSEVSHVLEITSEGALQGAMSWIVSTDIQEIETSDDLSAAGAGASYRVWQSYTISSLFGNPPTATTLGGGTDASTADTVQILDPLTGNFTNFFYQNSGKGGTGWKSTDLSITSPASYAIFPNDGILIQRKQSADGELVISGSVKTGSTKIRVEGNNTSTVLNLIANQIPVDQITLGQSNLYTGDPASGLKGGTDASTADTLLVLDASTGNFTTFFYQDSGKGGTGWKSSDLNIAVPSDYVLPSTKALLIQRKAGSAFNWTVPTLNLGE